MIQDHVWESFLHVSFIHVFEINKLGSTLFFWMLHRDGLRVRRAAYRWFCVASALTVKSEFCMTDKSIINSLEQLFSVSLKRQTMTEYKTGNVCVAES